MARWNKHRLAAGDGAERSGVRPDLRALLEIGRTGLDEAQQHKKRRRSERRKQNQRP